MSFRGATGLALAGRLLSLRQATLLLRLRRTTVAPLGEDERRLRSRNAFALAPGRAGRSSCFSPLPSRYFYGWMSKAKGSVTPEDNEAVTAFEEEKVRYPRRRARLQRSGCRTPFDTHSEHEARNLETLAATEPRPPRRVPSEFRAAGRGLAGSAVPPRSFLLRRSS